MSVDRARGLGRGLSALLPSAAKPDQPAASPANGLMELQLSQVDPNPTQPRQVFDPKALQELTDSIRANGLVQPIIVRRKNDRFEIVAGERRWRACREAGLTQVPVVVQDVADDRVLELALIENIQREDLNPIETAQAFQRLVKELEISHEELGRRTGKDRATITNFIRLLKLPADLQQMMAEGSLSMGQAKAILGLPTEELQRQLAEKAVAQGLSVRAVERLVQGMLEERTPGEAKKKKEEDRLDPNIKAAVEELEAALGTRVRIVPTNDNRGHIEIEYYSQEELHRIYGQIVGER